MNEAADRAFAQALSHHREGRLNEAADLYREALTHEPAHADALHLFGVLQAQAGEYTEAARLVEQALAAQPDNADIWCNLGAVYRRKGDLGRAMEVLRRAIELNPSLADAHNNLGNVFHAQRRWTEALDSYRKALELAPTVDMLCNTAIVLLELGRLQEARQLCDRALQSDPNNALVQICLGSVLSASGQLPEAAAAYRRALTADPGNTNARYNLGVALEQAGDWSGALDAYEATLGLDPDFTRALSAALFMCRRLCRWDNTEHLFRRVLTALEAGRSGITPFSFLAEASTPAQQRRCAELWTADIQRGLGAAGQSRLSSRQGASAGRITVGYVSSGFGEQPTGRLAVELFEQHDRSRFHTIGYSTRAHPASALKRRLRSAFETWVDAERMTRLALSERIRADGVDVLVDLRGYQDHAVTEVFAMRSAPVQVNFLSFPATMGADFMDYIIVDPFVVPPDQQEHFTERLIHLPHCYQPNDTRRKEPAVLERGECGLPENGMVFCCFNNSYKISPDAFASWMRILDAVEGSVLWLLDMNPGCEMPDNLRREAAQHGVAAERLVFAERADHATHLARLATADLFLDTWPYTAHTTASDALWAGCPVLSRAGDTFAGRVAGSILRAAQLPDQVVSTPDEYEALAIALGRDAERRRALRERVHTSRRDSPLFDMARYARHLERALELMHRTRLAGSPPTAGMVPPD